jgi:hypothetical protein
MEDSSVNEDGLEAIVSARGVGEFGLEKLTYKYSKRPRVWQQVLHRSLPASDQFPLHLEAPHIKGCVLEDHMP